MLCQQYLLRCCLDTIESLKEEEFDALYGDELDFSTACSDGNIVSVKGSGAQLSVDFETRLEYCQLVKKIRMFEFIDQVYVPWLDFNYVTLTHLEVNSDWSS